MTDRGLLAVLAAAIGALLLLALLRVLLKRRPAPGIDVRTDLPSALRHHTVWARERPFACRSPIALNGRIDECFVDRDGVLTVSDTKLRQRPEVYESDVLQLSAYRLLLEAGPRRAVSPVGYVRLITPKGNRYAPVRLLPAADVLAAADLHARLKTGREQGERCGNAALCRRCEYKVECDALGD